VAVGDESTEERGVEVAGGLAGSAEPAPLDIAAAVGDGLTDAPPHPITATARVMVARWTR
jgi:hypothetical protein